MSTFYFEEGWYPSEHLAKLLEANKKMNDHLAKAIGELGEGEVHTIHKWGAEKKEWVGLTDDDIQPESLLNSVHCSCGASWTFKNGALDYKPSTKKKEWVSLTDEEIIKLLRENEVFDYSIDQGNTPDYLVIGYVRLLEEKIMEKNA